MQPARHRSSLLQQFPARARAGLLLLSILASLASACLPIATPVTVPTPLAQATETSQSIETSQAEVARTPVPTRPLYEPGELVDYTAQTGDTLPALAARFNTNVAEIMAANPFIPASATTMPPGMPMKIPIYYTPFWGSQFKIIPDSMFVNGPAEVGFDVAAFIAGQPGWLKDYREYAFGDNRTTAQIINYVAQNFSVSPRLLLALLDYQAQGLSSPSMPANAQTYPLGNEDWRRKGLYLQLVWAANALNNGYYQWREGSLTTLTHQNGRIERPDPWQNAATVALQFYFSRIMPQPEYDQAIAYDGLAQTFTRLFGDPWTNDSPPIPGSLTQPQFSLPFLPGTTWALTGGPHTGFGLGEPYSALDFAPGALTGGCVDTDEFATAVAPGVVARSEPGTVILDLDGDGDERTGWVILYFHIGTQDRAAAGAVLQTGDPIGHPSCEGGRTTGTHVHIARLYNGEWIPASGLLAFNLDGWVAQGGIAAYQGRLVRGSRTITACECSDFASQLEAGR